MKDTLDFRPGSTILKEGEENNGLYVLEKGAVEVLKGDIMLNVLIYPGTIFGEIGEILAKSRTCTVKARTAAQVTRYRFESLEQLIREHPDVAARLLETLANRLEITTQKLADLSFSAQRG